MNSKKIPILVNDFVIHEDVCNSHCAYCLISDSTINMHRAVKSENGRVRFETKYAREPLQYETEEPLKKRIDQVLNTVEKYVQASILKISGGEVLVIKNIIRLLEERGRNYSCVQLLTNGLLLEERIIQRLAQIENLCVQLTMDGHTLEMNGYRVRKERIQQKLLTVLALLVKYRIPVEVNCVLTDRNTGVLDQFADYLRRYEDGRVILLPYPVRGSQRGRFFPKKEQIHKFAKLIEQYAQYAAILPPMAYLVRVYDYFIQEKRRFGCSIPLCMFQLFDNGTLAPCVNMWTTALGNLIKDDPDAVFAKIGQDKIYKIMTDKKSRPFFCRQCVTPWDIVNLYFEDSISRNEIEQIPLYYATETRAKLRTIKDRKRQEKMDEGVDCLSQPGN